ncbi:MAG TPA: hypothetical protein VGF67_26190 [Ktedonobacteraceae bacterium]|jgi:hypothetical protein
MKAHHEQACGDDELPDLWSLIDQPEEPETAREPASEQSAEQTPEPCMDAAAVPVDQPGETALAPALLCPDAYAWMEKLRAQVPATVGVVQDEGKTLYEHERYPGLLIDLDAYCAGHYDLPHLDERWFAVQLMRYDAEHGPMPWGDDLPHHRPARSNEAAAAAQRPQSF